MKLFACMCNQPQRLAEALTPVRAALVAEAPVSRWGMGYIQGGEALLVRTPKSSALPIDLAGPLFEAQLPGSDCVIVQAVRDTREPGLGGTDNTPPFRFRRWIFAQTGQLELSDAAPRLLAHVPEYLRRNLKGRTPAELMFHVFLAMLHDEGSLDDPNLPAQAMRRALASMLKLVRSELAKTGQADPAIGDIALTNGRAMVCARLADPLRLRRLWVQDDRGERDPRFRGVLVVSGSEGDADLGDGFEDVPPRSAVLISRDLQFHLADLGRSERGRFVRQGVPEDADEVVLTILLASAGALAVQSETAHLTGYRASSYDFTRTAFVAFAAGIDLQHLHRVAAVGVELVHRLCEIADRCGGARVHRVLALDQHLLGGGVAVLLRRPRSPLRAPAPTAPLRPPAPPRDRCSPRSRRRRW